MKMLTADLVKLDDNGAPWSDREIARRCKVDGKTVGRLRDELSFRDEPHLRKSADSHRTVVRAGTTYTQNTANIGKRQPAPTPTLIETETPVAPPTAAMVQHLCECSSAREGA